MSSLNAALEEEFDLVVLCGGDGTMLQVSSMFQGRKSPPLLPFSMGSLGFMTTFGRSVERRLWNRVALLLLLLLLYHSLLLLLQM